LAARESWDLPKRGAIRVLLGSQLGDSHIRQDLAWRTIQLLCDCIAGIPKLGDVRQAAAAVDVMDARCTTPRVAPRFRADAGASNQRRELLLCPWLFAGINESDREPVA